MRILLSRSTVQARPELVIEFLRVVADDVEFLRASYPRFDEWLLGKVIPGIYRGERTVLIEQRDAVIAGLLIVKHSELEKKLCTLRVRPHFESKGLGVRLFETAFDLLGTERPLLSVSETSRPKFSRLFTHFGFAQEATYEGRYLPKVDEFSYNGLLDVPPERAILDAYPSRHAEVEPQSSWGQAPYHLSVSCWREDKLLAKRTILGPHRSLQHV